MNFKVGDKVVHTITNEPGVVEVLHPFKQWDVVIVRFTRGPGDGLMIPKSLLRLQD